MVADRIGMAAWLLSFGVATSVDRCRFATRCCETHCNGCVKVARCRGCMRDTIVFCSCASEIVLEWLHPRCDSDLSADFLNFGASNFPFKNPLKKCFKIVFFLLWRRDPVLKLQFSTPLR